MDLLTRFARACFYLGLVIVLMIAGGALRAVTEPPRGPTIRFTGDADSQLFVCGRLEPGELTCLDYASYIARLKAKLEEQRHRSDM